jgi:hypothetical protein
MRENQSIERFERWCDRPRLADARQPSVLIELCVRHLARPPNSYVATLSPGQETFYGTSQGVAMQKSLSTAASATSRHSTGFNTLPYLLWPLDDGPVPPARTESNKPPRFLLPMYGSDAVPPVGRTAVPGALVPSQKNPRSRLEAMRCRVAGRQVAV